VTSFDANFFDESIYKVSSVINHPNYYQVEENVHVIKNFTTKEERDWFINIAESASDDQWNKDKRIWWNKKIAYIGDDNLVNPIVQDILQRIKNLFDDEKEEKWSFGGMMCVHRMQPGEAMFSHADNPSGTGGLTNHVIFGMVLYHNDFNGGEINYDNLNLNYKPEAGDLLMHPGSLKYTHSTLPVLPGPNRYISTTFAFDPKVKKIREKNMVFENLETGELDETENPITKYQMG